MLLTATVWLKYFFFFLFPILPVYFSRWLTPTFRGCSYEPNRGVGVALFAHSAIALLERGREGILHDLDTRPRLARVACTNKQQRRHAAASFVVGGVLPLSSRYAVPAGIQRKGRGGEGPTSTLWFPTGRGPQDYNK